MNSHTLGSDGSAAHCADALPAQAIAALLSKLKNHFYIYDAEHTCVHNGFSVYVDDAGVRIKLTPGRRTLDVIGNVPRWQVEETDYSLIPGYWLNRSGDYCLGRDMQQQVRLMPLCTALRLFLTGTMADNSLYPVLSLADLEKLVRGIGTGMQFYHLHVDELYISDELKALLRKDLIAKLRSYLLRHDTHDKSALLLSRS